MEEDFAPFEFAKKLKEKGYPQKTFGTYDMVGPTYFTDGRFYKDGCICHKDDAYTAPTISQVLKWLREEKNIHIVIDITNYGFISSTISIKWDKSYCDNEIEHYDHKGYSTYEEAAIAGITWALDNLI